MPEPHFRRTPLNYSIDSVFQTVASKTKNCDLVLDQRHTNKFADNMDFHLYDGDSSTIRKDVSQIILFSPKPHTSTSNRETKQDNVQIVAFRVDF